MKRGSFAAGFLTCLLVVGVTTTAYAAGIMAERSHHRVVVDGKEVQMEASPLSNIFFFTCLKSAPFRLVVNKFVLAYPTDNRAYTKYHNLLSLQEFQNIFSWSPDRPFTLSFPHREDRSRIACEIDNAMASRLMCNSRAIARILETESRLIR